MLYIQPGFIPRPSNADAQGIYQCLHKARQAFNWLNITRSEQNVVQRARESADGGWTVGLMDGSNKHGFHPGDSVDVVLLQHLSNQPFDNINHVLERQEGREAFLRRWDENDSERVYKPNWSYTKVRGDWCRQH